MLKAFIVCVSSVFLLIVSVNGGVKTRSARNNLPEELSVNAEHGTTEDSENEDYKGNSLPQADMQLENSDAVDYLGNKNENEENENNETANTTCGIPPDIEEATAPDLDDAEHALGTVINYQCDLGYVSRNSRVFPSTCEINNMTGKAEWTKPEISCSPRSCGDPGYVTNGHRIGNLFTFPNGIEFECDEGYKLKGLKSRYCQVNGEWSGRRLPTCELINCSAPANPVNGRVSYYSLGYGSKLRYECNQGFVLENHVTRVCGDNGKWSNKEPECNEVTCEKPPAPEWGSVIFPDGLAVGSYAMYSCDEGATLVGSATSKCLEDRRWLFDPPKCLRSCKIPEVEKGVTGIFETGQRYREIYKKFVPFKVGETVKHGGSVNVRCDEGFTAVDRTTFHNGDTDDASCNDGVWSKSTQCIPSGCSGPPPPTRNGSPVDNKRINHIHGSVIQYKCKEGFSKLKDGRVKCEYGTWEGQPPVCEDLRCRTSWLKHPGLKMPPRGYFASNGSFEIICEDGYEKTSSKEEIRCFKGKWEVESNPCTITRCSGPPPPTENGFPVVYEDTHGSDIQYDCKDGFKKQGNGNVTCEYGTWRGQPPLCRDTRCLEEPPDVENGSSVVEYNIHGSAIRYECNEGFIKLGHENVKCVYGTWRGQPPVCRDIRCYLKDLQRAENIAPVTPNITLSGKRLIVTCDEGYTTGSVIPFCLSGAWIRNDISPCKEMTCYKPPPKVKNAVEEVIYGAARPIVKYRCKEPYVLDGSSQIECMFGEWRGQLPKCTDIRCHTSWLDYPSGLKIPTARYFASNKSFEIICEEGYEKTSSKKEIRCFKGKWDVESNPCAISNTRPTQQTKIERGHTTSTEAASSSSSSVSSETCYCSFDPADSVAAYSGGVNSAIRKGETVDIRCRDGWKNFVWGNGLSLYGSSVQLTCDVCKNWSRSDLPYCRNKQQGDSFLSVTDGMKILPGGIIEIARGQNISFDCINIDRTPAWYPKYKGGISVNTTLYVGYSISSLKINGATDLHAGEYECYAWDSVYDFRSTKLILKIADEKETPQDKKSSTPRETDPEDVATTSTNSTALPTMAVLEITSTGDSFLSVTDGTKILPGGIIEIARGQDITFHCRNNDGIPAWYPSYKEGTFVNTTSYVGYYSASLKINGATDLHAGEYKCFALIPGYHIRSTHLILKIADPDVRCPEFPDNEQIDVTYNNESYVRSKAYFICKKKDAELIGNSTVKCLKNGKWSGPVPICRGPTEQTYIEREKNTTGTEAPSSSSSSVSSDTCYSSYNFSADSVLAYSRDRLVGVKSAIRKGDIVNLKCRSEEMNFVWMNELSVYQSELSFTCDTCKNWSRVDLPYCRDRNYGDSFLLINNNTKILLGGTIEISRGQDITFHCINFSVKPAWHPSNAGGTSVYAGCNKNYCIASLEINGAMDSHAGTYECYASTRYQDYRSTKLNLTIADITCPRINTNNNLLVEYTNDVNVNSIARFHCNPNARLIGENSAICMTNGEWSNSRPTCENITNCNKFQKSENLIVVYRNNDTLIGSIATFYCVSPYMLNGRQQATCLRNGTWDSALPTCEDLTCPDLPLPNGLLVIYTSGSKIGSTIKFRCPRDKTLVGNILSTCQADGTWDTAWPSCENYVSCERFETPLALEVTYSNSNRVGSEATFHCLPPHTLSGAKSAICLESGVWSEPQPRCEDYTSCEMIEKSENLEVYYDIGCTVGSIATFSCSENYTLVGSHQAECLPNGTWNSTLPSCKLIPGCSIDSLMQNLPDGVSPYEKNISEAFVPYGTELHFVCDRSFFLSGSSKTKCGPEGSWKHGAVECIPGCTLGNITSIPELSVQPVKDYYLLNETITFSCPPGQKLSSEVQQVTCKGNSWSDTIPGCKVEPQANP